jgi:hypothetical protein
VGPNSLHVSATNIFNKGATLFDTLGGLPYAGFNGPYVPRAATLAPRSAMVTIERTIGALP